jgi:hypothetical protein
MDLGPWMSEDESALVARGGIDRNRWTTRPLVAWFSPIPCMKFVSTNTALILLVISLSSAAVQAQITGFGDGTGWNLNSPNDTAPTITSGTLNIVNGAGVASSAFFNATQSITAFTASFNWINTVPADGLNPGDGFVFTLQNSGPTATGLAGGSLGYESISPASGVAFNLFTGSGRIAGIGYAPTSTGNGSYVYMATGSVDLDSTDPIGVTIQYGSGVLNVNLTDLNTTSTFSTSFDANLTGDAGGATAYVGFTGASGLAVSDQTISDFSFVSQIPEPSTNALMSFGLGTVVIGLCVMKRRACR